MKLVVMKIEVNFLNMIHQIIKIKIFLLKISIKNIKLNIILKLLVRYLIIEKFIKEEKNLKIRKKMMNWKLLKILEIKIMFK